MNTLKKIYLFVILFCPLFVLAQGSTVIISEIMYDSPLPEATGDANAHDGEFLSLYNYGNKTVDVGNWTVLGDYSSYIIPSGTKILPGGLLVIAYRFYRSSNFDVASFYTKNHSSNIPYPHQVLYQNTLILRNSTAIVQLLDIDNHVQDKITYTGTVYNGENPNLEGYMSVSLQRKNIRTDANTGLHVCNRYDYIIGTTSFVRLFSFNDNSTLTYTYDDGEQVIIESFDKRDISNTDSLGHPISGSLNVSSTGAATYTIPIEVPDGVRGMQPQLSLTYSSQSGAGIAGLGFHLQGLSAITRTGKNLFYDGERNNDFSEFMLDGQRLREINVSDGFTNYETHESPSFNDIRHYSDNDNFVVQTQGGMTMVYGDSANSSLIVSGKKLSYFLHEASDAYGNKIDYTYLKTGGQIYIDRINYGFNSSTSGTVITFHYINGPSLSPRYMIGGHYISGNKLLSRIEIRSSGRSLYAYEFEYETQAEKVYAVLKQVLKVRYTGINERFEELPLSFEWSAGNTDEDDLSVSTEYNYAGLYNEYGEEDQLDDDDPNYDKRNPEYNSSYVQGDIDGDGSEEVVRFGWKSVNVYRNAGFKGSNGIAYDADFTKNPYGWKTDKNPRFIIDMNGDGSGDLVGLANSQISITYSNGFIPQDQERTMNDQFTNTASVNDPDPNYIGMAPNDRWEFLENCPILFGDVNGDGLNDVVSVIGYGSKTYINNNGTFTIGKKISDSRVIPYGRNLDLAKRRYKLLDINADGKAELLVFTSTLMEYDGFGDDNVRETVIIDAFYDLDKDFSTDKVRTIFEKSRAHDGRDPYNVVKNFGDDKRHLFGDLNGDGLLDMVAINRDYVNIHYSRGTDVYNSTPDDKINNFNQDKIHDDFNNNVTSLGDINGDGMLDIIGLVNSDGIEHDDLVVLLNTGNGFVRKVWGKWNNSTLSYETDKYGYRKDQLILDYNGDGVSDVGIVVYGDHLLFTSNFGKNKDFRHLVGISDGSGVTTNITYDRYKKTQADIFSFPFREISGLDVVSEVTATTSNNIVAAHQKYSYNRAIADIRRGGLLGFLSTTVTDLINNTSATTAQELDTARSMLYPQSTSTYLHSGDSKKLLSSENYYYSKNVVILSYGTDTIKMLCKKRSTDKEKNITVQTEYKIDDYGNPAEEKTSIIKPNIPTLPYDPVLTSASENSAPPTVVIPLEIAESASTTEYLNYAPVVSGSIIKRPLTKKTVSGYKNGAQLEKVTTYTYNEHGDILTETTSEGIKETIYNDYGLPEFVTFTPSDNQNNSVTTFYDYTSDNRFVKTIEDDFGKTTKEYDLKYGRQISETNPFKQIKYYSYDNFGRIKNTTDEDGVKTTFIESDNGKTLHTKTSLGTSAYTYYDELGREIKTSIETADGTVITETVYDNKGRVSKKSEPYFEGISDIFWHNCSYDNRGRLTQTEYLGDITTYAYDGFTTTITEHSGTTEASTTSKTYNATGDIIKSTELSGEITYSYYYPSLPDTIKSNGIKTVITYDNRGRRTSILDPSAGLTTFTYDNQNRIILQTDANGTVSEFKYDKYGREIERTMMTEDYSSMVFVENKYDNKGLLLRSSLMSEAADDFYEVTTSYDYDDAGRLLFETQELDEGSFITGYDYDEYGRLNTKLFPNGFGIEYKYDNNGELSQISNLDDGSNIWHRVERNARGQYLSSTLGRNNNLLNSSDYDDWGNITGNGINVIFFPSLDYKTYTYSGASRLMSSRSGGFQGQSFSQTFPNVNEFSWHETFDYDGEKRLTGSVYSLNNQYLGSIFQTYAANGNLTYKSGVGNISYNAGNPYRIDQITFPSGSTTLPRSKEVEKHLYNQTVNYTPFQRVRTIIQDSNNTDFIDSEERADFTYNANYERVKMTITRAGSLLKQKYYAGDYEIVQTFKFENGIKMAYETDICYIRTPERLQAAYKRELPSGQASIGGMMNSSVVGEMYYFGTDHAGSITSVISEEGEVLERYQYDAWGNRRFMDNTDASSSLYYPLTNPTAADMRYLVLYEPLFDRGYIGEEHIDLFGLINLNARLYDPVLGRFLSPDPYVQAPDMLQNFNRYAYGLNNPLMYVDPSGEWWGIDDLIVAGVGFIFGYVSHGLTTGDWGWKAVANGGIGAVTAWLGYNTAGIATAGQGITQATGNYIGSMAINTVANQIIPPMNIPIGNNFGLSISPAFGIGATGLTAGFNMTGYYSNKGFSISAGIGMGGNYWGWNASAGYAGYGLGYGQTYYGNAIGPDGVSNAQRVANLSAFWPGGSFTFQNDIIKLGGNGDRWRTNALELTIGKFSIGSYIYTNDGQAVSEELSGVTGEGLTDLACESPIWGRNRKNRKGNELATWTHGEVFSAPVWVGYRHGNQIQRFGYSFRQAQDFQQNGIHKFIGRQQFYTNYNHFKSGFYSYSGYYNPLSLWGY
jgi:RHS repeat-associated protein